MKIPATNVHADWQWITRKLPNLDYSKNYAPDCKDVLKVFRIPLGEIRVVILGQDPYHRPGQANGYAFSVNRGVKVPPSLRNIFKELKIQCSNGNLDSWVEQGVFLLNTVLTVEMGKAHSHKGKGWEELTSEVIQHISSEKENVVFMIWGKYAAKFSEGIPNKHHVLVSSHPSPLSANKGFNGCNHFELANQYLESKGLRPISWKSVLDCH